MMTEREMRQAILERGLVVTAAEADGLVDALIHLHGHTVDVAELKPSQLREARKVAEVWRNQ